MALAATRSKMANADCFNPEAPKNMRNGELDARIGIIAERFCRRVEGEHRTMMQPASKTAARCKTSLHLVFSTLWLLIY